MNTIKKTILLPAALFILATGLNYLFFGYGVVTGCLSAFEAALIYPLVK